MKLSSSLLVFALAVTASASPLNAPRFGQGGLGRQRPGAGGANAAIISVAVGSVAASASVVDTSVANTATAVGTSIAVETTAAIGTTTAVNTATVVDTATAIDSATVIGTTTAVATSAAATGTASTGDNAAGTGAATGGDDPQTSLTLLQSVLATGFENDGQSVQEAGQVPSLTSSNNFINFCATVPDKPITNGQQITSGSCNPAPMGVIAAATNMPAAKFLFPTNNAQVPVHTNFTVRLAVRNLAAGNFVNPNASYFAAPQQVDAASGNVKGHSHVTIDALPALDSTAPTDPTRFAWFKGLNAPADQNGVLEAVVAGLPAGAYRIASINSAANHQPVLVAVAQHGSLDDMVYFTVV